MELVITIIILLILAVVALREITGDGIIAKAKEARSRFETEQGIENGILADYEDELESALSGGGSGGTNAGGTNAGGTNTELTEEEKTEIEQLFMQYYMNKDEETKATLLEKGVDISSTIIFRDENGNLYLYIKNNLNILMLAGDYGLTIVDANTVPISILNDLYEIAAIAEQEVKTKTDSSDDFIINYKGKSLEGRYNAAPWEFTYKGYTVSYTYYGSLGEGQGTDYTTVKYIGV